MPEPVSYSLPDRPHNRGLNVLAWVLCVATFPLVFIGGLVTSTGTGMSVPDWPNTFGYNMFTAPIEKWGPQTSAFFEHSHRLFGSLVGMLAVALCLVALFGQKRRAIKALAIAILAAVIVQGVLGGVRVLRDDRALAMIHGCFAQAFFCLTVLMGIVTSRWWTAPQSTVVSSGLYRLAVLSVCIVYIQLILGALVRHYEAALAIPDFPLVFGRLIPPFSSGALPYLQQWREAHGFADAHPYTLTAIWLQYIHRLGALAATISIIALFFSILRNYIQDISLSRPAVILINLLVAQVIFGAMILLLAYPTASGEREDPATVATTHVAIGALVLATTFAIAVRTWKMRATEPAVELQTA